MRISKQEIEIAEEKLLNYLLVKKERNDKSAFLGKLGYTNANWEELRNDIMDLASSNEAILQQTSDFGDLYEVKGKLKGYGIVTIWLSAIGNDKFRFITLFPDRS